MRNYVKVKMDIENGKMGMGITALLHSLSKKVTKNIKKNIHTPTVVLGNG